MTRKRVRLMVNVDVLLNENNTYNNVMRSKRFSELTFIRNTQSRKFQKPMIQTETQVTSIQAKICTGELKPCLLIISK